MDGRLAKHPVCDDELGGMLKEFATVKQFPNGDPGLLLEKCCCSWVPVGLSFLWFVALLGSLSAVHSYAELIRRESNLFEGRKFISLDLISTVPFHWGFCTVLYSIQ
jgi:hypothetical protein